MASGCQTHAGMKFMMCFKHRGSWISVVIHVLTFYGSCTKIRWSEHVRKNPWLISLRVKSMLGQSLFICENEKGDIKVQSYQNHYSSTVWSDSGCHSVERVGHSMLNPHTIDLTWFVIIFLCYTSTCNIILHPRGLIFSRRALQLLENLATLIS